jgi:putative hemin transport protein
MADGPLDPQSPRDSAALRALIAGNPKARARDLAAAHGLTEADLLVARVGHGATAIDPAPDRLIPLVESLGDVMALTRNDSCVHERKGHYRNFTSGKVASIVLDAEIDLRIFPKHWVHGFALTETASDGAVKRSLQVFDAAGDAVHKVHLHQGSDAAAFDRLVAALRRPVQADRLQLAPRAAAEGALVAAENIDAMRDRWDRMTDPHQFLPLTKKMKMNRLGAYRGVGAPHAVPLPPEAVTEVLTQAAAQAIPVMIFVGNAGCIQIHGGPIGNIVPMGPWINVMDPRFNLHLRADHIAEVWAVTKPSETGPAISVEAFDAAGGLILQIFGYRKDTPAEPWNALVGSLPRRGAA